MGEMCGSSLTRPRNRRGFTLVEVMVAAAVLTLIMAIIYGSFAGSLKSMEISEEMSVVTRSANLILDRMVREIGNASLLEDASQEGMSHVFVGEDREEDGVPRDTLNFVSTAAPLRGPNVGFKEVGYVVEIDAETNDAVLVIREDAPADDDPKAGGRKYALGRGIWGLDFTYYDDRGREWERWESDNPLFSRRLPRVVTITLILKTAQGEPVALSTKTWIQSVAEQTR